MRGNYMFQSSASSSGGGGGGSLRWVEAALAPVAEIESNFLVYFYEAAITQYLYAAIKVPQSYSGSQIKLFMPFYSPDTSNDVLLQTVSTLIRTGLDAISSTTNQRTSTNSAVTLSAGTQNEPQMVTFDLTSSSGQINSVNVSAGDTILVQLTRGTDTATSEARAMVFCSEVTFT